MTLEEMKRIKQEKGYSLAQLSEFSGVPLGTVQKIFSGETEHPRYATLQALERALLQDRSNYRLEKVPSKLEEAMIYDLYNSKKQGEYTLGTPKSKTSNRGIPMIVAIKSILKKQKEK